MQMRQPASEFSVARASFNDVIGASPTLLSGGAKPGTYRRFMQFPENRANHLYVLASSASSHPRAFASPAATTARRPVYLTLDPCRESRTLSSTPPSSRSAEDG